MDSVSDGNVDPAVIEANRLLAQDLSELAASAPDDEPMPPLGAETSET